MKKDNPSPKYLNGAIIQFCFEIMLFTDKW